MILAVESGCWRLQAKLQLLQDAVSHMLSGRMLSEAAHCGLVSFSRQSWRAMMSTYRRSGTRRSKPVTTGCMAAGDPNWVAGLHRPGKPCGAPQFYDTKPIHDPRPMLIGAVELQETPHNWLEDGAPYMSGPRHPDVPPVMPIINVLAGAPCLPVNPAALPQAAGPAVTMQPYLLP